jgi:hypothetical protein
MNGMLRVLCSLLVQRPPLEFHALKDQFEGVAAFDPSTECQAKHDIALEKAKAQDSH